MKNEIIIQSFLERVNAYCRNITIPLTDPEIIRYINSLKSGDVTVPAAEVWVARDGREQDVTLITNPHLINIIKLIERCAYEQDRFGESAEAEEKLEYLGYLPSDRLFTIYLALKMEVVRRGIMSEFIESCKNEKSKGYMKKPESGWYYGN